MTGTVAFNQQGDRLGSLYEVINIQYGRAKVVGTYRSNTVSEDVEFLGGINWQRCVPLFFNAQFSREIES